MIIKGLHHCLVCDQYFVRIRNRGNIEICTRCQRKARSFAWKRANPERKLELNRRWDRLNREKSNKMKAEWSKRNLSTEAAKAAKYRAKKYNATPLWANDEMIKQIYEDCPNGFHVDHIFPLQGKTVSGLHVETNLQYLSGYDNRSKTNKFLEVIT